MSLDHATRELYAAFSKYPKPRHMQASPARSDAAKIAWPAMERTPLQQLSGDDLFTFARAAVDEWGTINDFKHFLPRMLELAANGDARLPADSVTAKLGAAFWQQWPAPEPTALRNFGIAWWQQALEPPAANIHAVLSIIGQFLNDDESVRAMMSYWRPDFSNEHLDLLARFVLQEEAALRAQPPTLSTALRPMAPPMTRWIADQLPAFEEGLMYNPDAPPYWHQAKQVVQMMHASLSLG
jgi:hypothetical protein